MAAGSRNRADDGGVDQDRDGGPESAQEAMADAYARVPEHVSSAEAVETYVAAFLAFLARGQTFLRLVQREALRERSRVAGFFGLPSRRRSRP